MSEIIERIKKDKLKAAIIGTSIIIFIVGIVISIVNTGNSYAATEACYYCPSSGEYSWSSISPSTTCHASWTTTNATKQSDCGVKTCYFCTGTSGTGNNYFWGIEPTSACNGGSWQKKNVTESDCKTPSTCYFCTGTASNGDDYFWGITPTATCNGGSWQKKDVIESNCRAPATYTITYDANGGSGAPNPQTKIEDVTLTLTRVEPVREGFTFLGWDHRSTVTMATYHPGDPYTANAGGILYAIWQRNSTDDGNDNTGSGDNGNTGGGTSGGNSGEGGTETNPTYTVTFNANGGSVSQTSKSVTYNSTYGSLPTPTKTGHKFTGWYTEANGGTQITSSSSVKITSNQTLYAHWSINKVKIQYKVEGGTITSSTTLDGTKHSWTTTSDGIIKQDGNVFYNSVNYGQNINEKGVLDYNNPNFAYIEKTGYTTDKGKEWKCLSGCTQNGSTFNQGDIYEDKDFCDASNGDCEVTLGVNWVAIKYNIDYKLNGGKNSTTTGEVTWGSNITINNPTKTVILHFNENKTSATIGEDIEVEQEFTGWTSTTINKNTAYHGDTAWTDGNVKVKDTTFKNLTSNNNGIVTMIANWEPLTVNLPAISKEGYTCNWNTKADGKGTKYNSGAKYAIGSESPTSINLYAECIANSKADEEISSPPKTGDILIVIAWSIGIGALGYTVYYFRSRKSNI